jgi:hypothetical protein
MDKKHMGSFIEVGLSRGYSYTQWTLRKPRESPRGGGWDYRPRIIPLLSSMKPSNNVHGYKSQAWHRSTTCGWRKIPSSMYR